MEPKRIFLLKLLTMVASVAMAFSPTRQYGFLVSDSSIHRKQLSHAPPQTYRSNTKVYKMSTDAETEASKLREQAKKLREEAASAAGVSVEELMAKVKSNDGTVYDDESEVPKENLSLQMKERLMREASTGLDSNKSQNNVILYISLAIVVLVLLGGQGILF